MSKKFDFYWWKRFEKSKGRPSEGLTAYAWRGICLLFGSVGLVCGTMKNRNLTNEYIDDKH